MAQPPPQYAEQQPGYAPQPAYAQQPAYAPQPTPVAQQQSSSNVVVVNSQPAAPVRLALTSTTMYKLLKVLTVTLKI